MFTAKPPTREVLRVEAMFNAGRIQDAVFACVDLARKDPDMPGLADLQSRIGAYLAANRAASFETVNKNTHAGAMTDVKRHGSIPLSYGQRRHIIGETSSHKTGGSKMQEALDAKVSIDLENADLGAIITEIGRSQNINIVADSSLSDATMTIRANQVPLSEILEYVGRNLNVVFSVGQNMIWVTSAGDAVAGGSAIPMETRVYRLRKGLADHEMRPSRGSDGFSSSTSGSSSGRNRTSNALSQAAGGGAAGGGGETVASTPVIIDTVTRFVPQPEGADILWDDKSHALFVKNTRENLILTEEIIDSLDIQPIQVLIEARFMTIGQSDTRELGIDWLLDNQHGSPAGGGSFWEKTTPGNLASPALYGYITSGSADFLYQTVLGRTAVQAVIHALEESGKSQTLAVPRVTTHNNREARFRKGEDFRYYEDWDIESYSAYSGGSGNNDYGTAGSRLVPSGDPTIEELGYSLVVTPSVGADLTSINLRLLPEISSFKEWEYYYLDGGVEDVSGGSTNSSTRSAIKLPTFLRSAIDTAVTVRSGETIILGGMIDTAQSVTVQGVPFLSKLPWIGGFFRTETKENKPSNLLIFVTATIISDTGEELVSMLPQVLPGLPVPEEEPEEEEPEDLSIGPPAPPALSPEPLAVTAEWEQG